MFYLWLHHTKYYFLSEGWDGAYLLIRFSKYLLLLAYREVPLLIISILARQPFTKLIVWNFTRFSSRTNCFTLLHFAEISLPKLLYHDLLIRGVASLVKGINLNIYIFVYRYTLFFNKNIVYKNIQAQIGQKIKNILKISSASVLAIVFCFYGFFSKIFLINRTILI